MSWPQTGTTHYHAKLGLPDKDRAINGLVVYYIVRLESLKGIGLGTSVQVPCCGQDGYRAQVLKHPNSFVIMKIPLNPYPSLIMKLNQYFSFFKHSYS